MQCRTNRPDGSKSQLVVLALSGIFLTSAILTACASIAAEVQGSARPPAHTKPVETTVSKPADGAKKTGGIHAAPPRALRSEAAIREALEATADLDFTKTPLDDIVGVIGDFTKIDIVLDKKALADAGVATDLPMTVSLRGISVRAALGLILRNLGLTWIVRDEVVLITTPEEAENWLETRVYDVSDLVLPQSSYPFEGMYIPEARGGRVGAGGGMKGVSGPGAPSGGMGTVAMGGAAGVEKEGHEAGGRMGGGLFAVVEPLPPSEGSEPAKPSNPAPHKEQPKPATPSGTGGRSGMGGGRSGGMGGMGGGMGGTGGMGGGPAHGSGGGPVTSTASQRDFDSLIDLIKTSVKPTTWDDVGGPGSIAPLEGPAGMLVFHQTQEIHQRTEKLLEQIREARSKVPLVTVRAFWLLLDMKQLDDLLASKSGKGGGIDRKTLREMAEKVKGYAGTISCFSGQTVHIASTRSRSAVVGAIPVVGSGIGYQPIVSNPQCGAMLQVTPQVLPGAKTAVVDLWSSVVRSEGPGEQIHFLNGKRARKKGDKGDTNEETAEPSVTLDRVNAAVEQLGTTIRLPLGEATLVGGITREPSADQAHAGAAPQLYLFIEVTAR
jgi:hypothetical protein